MMVIDQNDLLVDFYAQQEKPEKSLAFLGALICQIAKGALLLFEYYLNLPNTSFTVWITIILIGTGTFVLYLKGKRLGWILVMFFAILGAASGIINLESMLKWASQDTWYMEGKRLLYNGASMIFNLLIIFFSCTSNVTKFCKISVLLRISVIISGALGVMILYYFF